MKQLIITSVLALAAITLHLYWLNQANIRAQLLKDCAKANNVYACKFKAVPVEAPRVVYHQAEILPPPVK